MQVQKMANVTNTMPLKHAAVAIYADRLDKFSKHTYST